MSNITTSTILAGLLAASPALAQPAAYGDRPMGWDWFGAWGWGHMLGGGLFMLLFWVAVIVLAVYLVRALTGGKADSSASPSAKPDALRILDERFARGEISREEHEEQRKHLLQQRDTDAR